MKSCILRTDVKGNFRVHDMFANGQLSIALPNRASLTLVRIGDILILESDLGRVSSECDLKRICVMDLEGDSYPHLEKTYSRSVHMDPAFMAAAKSYDCDFHVKKFVDSYVMDTGNHISTKLFGPEMLDQVWVTLKMDEMGRSVTNIEFSVIKAEYMDDEKRDEPAMTIAGSIRIKGQMLPHYFLFIKWWGDELWAYGRNFFFNNSKFPAMRQEKRS